MSNPTHVWKSMFHWDPNAKDDLRVHLLLIIWWLQLFKLIYIFPTHKIYWVNQMPSCVCQTIENINDYFLTDLFTHRDQKQSHWVHLVFTYMYACMHVCTYFHTYVFGCVSKWVWPGILASFLCWLTKNYIFTSRNCTVHVDLQVLKY